MRRRGPRPGQEADGGEDVADRGDPVRGVLAPLPHILHPRILRAKYVDTQHTATYSVSTIFGIFFNLFIPVQFCPCAPEDIN